MLESIKLGIRQLCSRPMYVLAMVLVPLLTTLFFVDLMDEGLPLRTPVGILDQDHSKLSRQVTRMLNAEELLDVCYTYETFDQAMESVRRGESFGLFIIPENFERNAVAGNDPSLSLFTNMSFFVPGTLSFKGFKTGAVLTKGGMVVTNLTAVGLSDRVASSLIQPVVIDSNQIGNPWTNYNYYLTNSFMPALLQLMVMLVTIYSISQEIKWGTSVRWLQVARGSMLRALVGKLLPQTVIFTVVGLAMLGILFGFCHFPINCPPWQMALAMTLMVLASQAFGLFLVCVLPNPRLALSVASLIGILTFSVAAFSYPVPSMYGAVGIFSYLLPVRYYFLIYINQALNGLPMYYSRFYFAALLLFTLVPFTMLWKLKRACLKPVYVL